MWAIVEGVRFVLRVYLSIYSTNIPTCAVIQTIILRKRNLDLFLPQHQERVRRMAMSRESGYWGHQAAPGGNRCKRIGAVSRSARTSCNNVDSFLFERSFRLVTGPGLL